MKQYHFDDRITLDYNLPTGTLISHESAEDAVEAETHESQLQWRSTLEVGHQKLRIESAIRGNTKLLDSTE